MTCTAPRHGSLTAYKDGCRCPTARQDATRAQKLYRLRLIHAGQLSVDSTATRRRVQALGAVGWRAHDIGIRIGTTSRAVSLLLTRDRVYLTTAERVAAVYDQLADHQGPSAVTARRAAAKGWLQPLWWDDDTIDDPTFDPIEFHQDKQTSPRDHRSTDTETVAELSAKGWPAARIADHLGCSTRRVVRLRAHLRATTRPDVSAASGNVTHVDQQQVAS